MRELFPGYYPPPEGARQDVFVNGLVSLDANALLALYRFTPRARLELLTVLDAMRDRLFITHQAALEFHRDRLEVVDSRLGVASEESGDIAKLFTQAADKIRSFATRYQIDAPRRDQLVSSINQLSDNLASELQEASTYDLEREEVKNAADSVIVALDKILRGRVGKALDESSHEAAMKEAARRRTERVPPGYADASKPDPARQAGDYLVWRQLLDEAKIQNQPVLFVSDDKKEDWVRYGRNKEQLGPRPELVLEMYREAGVQLHTASVLGLLLDAPKYLGTQVSRSTLHEAEILPKLLGVQHILTNDAEETFKTLSESERKLLISSMDRLGAWLGSGNEIQDFPEVSSKRATDGTTLLNWGKGRALFVVEDLGDSVLRIHWLAILKRKPISLPKSSVPTMKSRGV